MQNVNNLILQNMRTLYFKNIRAIIAITTTMVWGNAWGQVTVTNPSNTTPAMSATYSSLDLAIADVNNRTAISGPVTITLDASSPQTAPAGGYSITNTAITGGSTTNRFIFDGGGNTITAPSPQTSGNLNDAIFKIIGADFITIQNFTMQENAANTTTTETSNNMTEFGVALFYATTTNGAENNIIQNNTISLNRAYQNTFGIYANATHTATAVTTSATATGPGGGNSGLKIFSNTISNVNNGILVLGPTAAANFNTGIDIGGSSTATANTISNFGTTGTFSAFANVSGTVYGVFIRNSIGFNVSYNSITSSNGGVASGTLRGIFNMSASVTPTGTFTNNINNNTIALTYGVASGTLQGITVELRNATTTSIGNINNNNFTALTASIATSANITAISAGAPHLTLSISGNTLTNLSTNTTGNFIFLGHSYTMPPSGTQTLNNNSIVTAFNKTGAGGIVTIASSGGFSSPNGTTHTFTNNNFSNITVTGATEITGVWNADGSHPSPTRTVTGNTFNNWIGGTGAINGLRYEFIGGTTSSFSSNTFTNITGQGFITGIYLGVSSNSAITVNVASNTINNLSSTGTGGQVTGIICYNNSATININGNTINSLSSTGAITSVGAIDVWIATTTNVYQNVIYDISASGATSPWAYGISAAGGSLVNVNVYRNKIYNLSASGGTLTSSNPNGAVNGIYLSGTKTVNAYNNLIGNLTAPNINLADAIRGINVVSTTASSSYNVYNNTVYLTGGSAGTNFGTSGIYHTASATATTAALDLQNNMIFNTCTPSGTGIVTAFRRSAAATLGNYKSTSNKNLFYAGTPSASTTIMSDGTNNYQTISTFQTAVSSRDANSYTESAFNPATYFVSTTGSNANFLQPASGLTTLAEGGGNTIALCSPDYNGVTRPGFSGAYYDVGAWEFAGISPAPVLTNMTPSPALTAQCTKADRAISIDVTTSSGTITSVTLNYSHNGTAQTAVAMTNSSGNTWTGTMLAPSTGNASVTWSVTATNSIGLSTTYTGTTYSDEPNTGITAAASVTPSTVCAGSSASLSMSIGNSSAPTGYCLLTAATSTASYFNMFSTSGGSLNINNASSGFSTGGYGNFTNLSVSANLNTTINFNTTLIGTTVGVAIWVDWNQNGTFETTERVYVTSGYVGTASGSFVVPSNASFGFTRMRILMDYSNGSPSNPCGPFVSGRGEVEDYLFCVLPTPTAYSWSNGTIVVGTTNPLSTPITAGLTYTATATVNGCPITAAVSPTVLPLPTAPTATNSSQCGAGTPTCSVSGTGSVGNTFRWYLASTGGTAIVGQSASTLSSYPVSASASFYVSEFNGTCESPRTQVNVTFNTPPTISVAASVNPVCSGSATSLSASSANTGYTYAWSNSLGSGASVSASPTTNTTYTVTATDNSGGANNGCATTNSIVVTTNPIPSALTLSPSATTGVCVGSVQTISLTSGGAMPNQTIMSENFDNDAPSWNTTLTAGLAGTRFYFQSSPYSDGSGSATFTNFSTPQGGKFAMGNADAGSTGVTSNTTLVSPVFSTVGYSAATLTFEHAFRTWSSDVTVAVEISTDGGTSWTSVQSYLGSSVGTTTNNDQTTSNASISLASYLNQNNLRIRFNYVSAWGYYWIIDNVRVSGTIPTDITWSPTTDLYTDAAATSAYTGTAATTLYAKLTANRTYTATSTIASTGCTNTKSVQLNNNTPANNVVLASSTQTGAVQQCTDATGWTYYATTANPNAWIFAINKGTTGMTGETINIEVLGSNPSSTSSAGINQQHGSYLMKRGWDVTGTVPTGSVSVRFFYDPADTTSLNTDRDAGFAALSAGSLAVKTGFEWFKSTGTPYNSTWRALVVGNKFPSSHVKLTPTFGTINGVNYVEFSGITSFSGGSGGSGFGPPSSGGGVGLPVTWAGFDAVAKESGNDLTWKTASEMNTSHFEVEYSYDGINFNKSAIKVPAAGSSQTLKTYTYTHNDVSTFVYYRIKQVDMDSRSEYSATKLVKRTDAKTFQVSVYPIPVLDDQVLNVEVKAIDKSDLFITILDMNGRIVKSRTTKPTTNSILVEKINVSNLSNGLYQVVIQNGQGKEVVKFSK
jgi:trimeric autotransporter adhesin